MNTPKPVTLILRGQSHTDAFPIVAFSMLDSSLSRCRFQTSAGLIFEASGLVLSCRHIADIDALPACPAGAPDAIILDA